MDQQPTPFQLFLPIALSFTNSFLSYTNRTNFKRRLYLLLNPLLKKANCTVLSVFRIQPFQTTLPGPGGRAADPPSHALRATGRSYPTPASCRGVLPEKPEFSQQSRVLLGFLGGGLRGLFVLQPEPLDFLEDLSRETTEGRLKRKKGQPPRCSSTLLQPFRRSFSPSPASGQQFLSWTTGTDSNLGQVSQHSPTNRCDTQRKFIT